MAEGHGYSKKESQQEAAKLTLQRLRREPQFIDEVFTAKANRTKMEEEPVLNVPETSQHHELHCGGQKLRLRNMKIHFRRRF